MVGRVGQCAHQWRMPTAQVAWWWASGAGQASAAECGVNSYRGSAGSCACSKHAHRALGGARDATVCGARRQHGCDWQGARCSSSSARINARTPRGTLRRYEWTPWPCDERCAACFYGHASTQRALDVGPELQRRHPPRQRYSLSARRTHALSSHTRAPCERRHGTSRRAPPGTGDDVAASLGPSQWPPRGDLILGFLQAYGRFSNLRNVTVTYGNLR